MTLRPRKAHVKRIYQIDEEGNKNLDIWIDVLRIDELAVEGRGFLSGITGAFSKYKFKWLDAPDSGAGDVQQENGNSIRKTKKLKIENPEDPASFIELWIVVRQKIRFPTKHADQYEGWSAWFTKYFYDDAPADGSDPGDPPHRPADRKVNKMRVANNDLGGLDMTNGPVDWDKVYLPALKNGVVDASQYVDTEFVENFKMRYGQLADGEGNYQRVKFRLQNDAMAKLLDVGGAGKDSAGNATKIDRLDPLQMIVNVNWGSPIVIIGVDVSWTWDTVPPFGNPFPPGTYVGDVVLNGTISTPPTGFVFGGVSFPKTHPLGSAFLYGPPLDLLSPIVPRPNWTTAGPFSGSIGFITNEQYGSPIPIPLDLGVATLHDPHGRAWVLQGMTIIPAATQGDGAISVDDPDTEFPRPFNSTAWLRGSGLAGFFLTFKPPS